MQIRVIVQQKCSDKLRACCLNSPKRQKDNVSNLSTPSPHKVGTRCAWQKATDGPRRTAVPVAVGSPSKADGATASGVAGQDEARLIEFSGPPVENGWGGSQIETHK
ncbi:hypothetical protein EYF80_049258 [Liparis tanakae]|uniref:Uncharacterized protein n=1 Tax=Liparis tanakae TaxID=230148 RepID=A0A4Z2FH75_9TELE|nr:hypothetical protein EYF80_049258 [Liparis tanakae]